ncbi:DUF1573 domain-containing protein [Stieleria neptunia]|nr:DUF1573 domain-containing protein [Stieleria neptunia]
MNTVTTHHRHPGGIQHMFRATVIVFATLATSFSFAASALAQSQWPDNAFAIKKHDFGTVAVASKTEFRFPVYNPYTQPLHIQTVRRSCGCTTPIVETEYIEPGQTGSILARFNTDTFRGTKGATLTVVVDKPFFSEVRLRVDGYIRSDMVFHPGAIEFGTINQGDTASKTTRVLYAGRSDWEIADVRSNVPWLVPSKKLLTRSAGRADYELTVAVREDAPTGPFQNEIIVITNDTKRPEVPFPVSGTVESPLSISPQAIAFGSLKPGQKIEKRLVIKGASPFTIESITCEGWDVAFPQATVAKTIHIVPATFTPTDAEGPQKVTVLITTAGDQSVTAKAILTADIREE